MEREKGTWKMSDRGGFSNLTNIYNMMNKISTFSNRYFLLLLIAWLTPTVASAQAPGSIQLASTQDFKPGVTSFSHNGAAYFLAKTSSTPYHLWRTDGTSNGTFKVGEINKIQPSEGQFFVVPATGNMMLYFPPDLNSFNLYDSDLYQFEDAPNSLQLIRNLSNEPYTHQVRQLGDKFVISHGSLPGTENQIWVTDGTAAGTVLMDSSSSNYFHSFVDLPGTDVHYVEVNSNSARLTRTDGTLAGTSHYASIPDASLWASTVDLSNFSLFWVLYTNGPNVNKSELWRTDGTAAGTFPIYNGDFSVVYKAHRMPGSNRACWITSDFVGNYQLWRSDGTTTGTQMLMDFGNQGHTLILGTEFPNGRTYEVRHANGMDYWYSDGTVAGTQLLAAMSMADHPQLAHQYPGKPEVFFVVQNDATNTVQLWKSDLSFASGLAVDNMGPGLEIAEMEGYQNGYLYGIKASNNSMSLWSSQGINGTTKRLYSASGVGEVSQFYIPPGGNKFYACDQKQPFSYLIESDGTPAGTQAIQGMRGLGQRLPYFNDGFYLAQNTFTIFDSIYYYDPNQSTWPLWTGHQGYVRAIESIDGPLGVDYVYLLETNGTQDWEIWKLHGTALGLADAEPTLHPQLYPNPGRELWVTLPPEELALEGIPYVLRSPTGSVVRRGQLMNRSTQIESQGLPAGVYLLDLGQGKWKGKWVKIAD